MSDISTYLQQIMQARYGEEVRGAIHDAIEECYDDVSTAKTIADDSATAANAAAASATSAAAAATSAAQHAVLYDSVQTLTDAQKEQARENIEAAFADDVDNLKSAIVNIEDSLIRDDYYTKIVRNKVSDMTLGVINTNTGSYGTSGTRICHLAYIPVDYDGVQSINCSIASGYKYNLSWYSDASESAFISGVTFNTNNKSYSIPNGAKYVRFSIADTSDSNIQHADWKPYVNAFNLSIVIAINQVGMFVSYMEFGTDVDNSPTQFIPYLNVPNANAIYSCNRNLYYGVTYSNNNYAGFDMVTTSASTRVRTNSMMIPMGCKQLVLSGLPTDVSLLGVRSYDIYKNRLNETYAKVVDNGDGSYLIKINDNVAYIHFMFGKGDNDTFDFTVFDNNNVMLEIGSVVHEYVAPARTQFAVASMAGQAVSINAYKSTAEYTVLFALKTHITFYINVINTKSVNTELYRFRSDVTEAYSYEYYHISNQFDFGMLGIDTTASEYNRLLTTLANEHPDYMIATSMGTDSSETYNVMYCKLSPVLSADATIMIKKPAIYIIANQHGYEKGGAITAYYLMKLLCENPDNSDMITYLRHNVDFHIIPLMNPYGFNQYDSSEAGSETGYTNYNSINLNRNWSIGFENGDGSGGTSAFSEKETTYAREQLNNIGRVDLAMDVHCNGTTRRTNNATECNWLSLPTNPTGGVVIKTGKAHLANVAPYMCKRANITYQVWGKMSEKTIPIGSANDFFNYYNIPALTFELTHKLPNEESEFTANCNKANLEMLINYIAITLAELKQRI